MRFYNSNNRNQIVDLTTAIVQGMPSDKGLYMPCSLPKARFLSAIKKMSLPEISLEIAKAFLCEDLSSSQIQDIVQESINFAAPVVEVEQNIGSLELFHGPTLAFKDFGARFMSRLLGELNKTLGKQITIVVATSGDTGSAVANGFLGVEGVRVVILYPSGKVSPLQEKQLTTLGQNITALEVAGDFDDCQAMAKAALSDADLGAKMQISSANSINIGRLIPQTFYYFGAFAQLEQDSFWVSIPSGNFGNLTACVFAKKMGLPVEKIIASCNANNVVPRYLASGNYAPKATLHTIASAMDVGNPSNTGRLFAFYDNDLERFRQDLEGADFTDQKARAAIKEVYSKFGYLMDPHGAFAYLGLKQFLPADKFGVFVETAHPAKFTEEMESILGEKPELPDRLAAYAKREKVAIPARSDYDEFKQFLLQL